MENYSHLFRTETVDYGLNPNSSVEKKTNSEIIGTFAYVETQSHIINLTINNLQ